MQKQLLYLFHIFGALFFYCSALMGQEMSIPVLAQGRVRPLISYSYLMEKQFCWDTSSMGGWRKTIELLWKIERHGSGPFFHDPLFVLSPSLVARSGLLREETAYSYLQLKEVFRIESPLHQTLSQENSPLLAEFLQMVSALQRFQRLQKTQNPPEIHSRLLAEELEKRGLTPFQIAEYVDASYPLSVRLQEAGELFRVLPGTGENEWFPVDALAVDVFDPATQTFIPSPNFTRFSSEDFRSLQTMYRREVSREAQDLSSFLLALEMAHTRAKTRTWSYSLEAILMYFPWVLTIALFYLLAGLIGTMKSGWRWGRLCFLLAFFGNAGILLIRSLVLKRPPVSNMTETLLFVPFVGSSVTLIYSSKLHLAACIGGVSLLILSWWQEPIPILGNLQPVLNSWMWLSWHVLLVVSSYALFLIASLIGHVCLLSSAQKGIGALLLKVLYTGVMLLILGTLLGGAWAAESWGRFWDWDPKESWAFISICTYLLFIHAFQRGYIGYWGLGVGAILGFLSISFTWYGVNYLLGVGLHSYGFGRGGVQYYLAFLCAELVWLVYCAMKRRLEVKQCE